IAAGGYHTCALRAGAVLCWGANDSGQLGDGTALNRFVAVETMGAQSDVTAITAGTFHSCAIAARNATCWGWNRYGQLGDGTTIDQSKALPVAGLGSDSVAAIAAGGYHTCALTVDSQLRCWGLNQAGQLGDATRTDRLTPVPVLALTTPT